MQSKRYNTFPEVRYDIPEVQITDRNSNVKRGSIFLSLGLIFVVALTVFSQPEPSLTELSALQVEVVVAQTSQAITAEVLQCVDMIYSSPATDDADRPTHLRAASSMQWLTDTRMIVLQDDTAFIGLVDVQLNLQSSSESFISVQHAISVQLPTGPNGTRMFQESRGNKGLKLDLEASVLIPGELSSMPDNSSFLMAFGSGSKGTVRDVIVLLKEPVLKAQSDVSSKYQAVPTKYWQEYEGLGEHQVSDFVAETSDIIAFSVPELYNLLRSTQEFSGSELNIEGVLLIPDEDPAKTKLRFFQRGNGAPDPISGLEPISATADILLTEVTALLNRLLFEDQQQPLFDLDNDEQISLGDVLQYELGLIQPAGVSLTFTGAAQVDRGSPGEGQEFVYIAGAEASPDATKDGVVVGVALGIGGGQEHTRYSMLHNLDGSPFLGKAEGVGVVDENQDLESDDRILHAVTVLDRDNPNLASQVCLIRIFD